MGGCGILCHRLYIILPVGMINQFSWPLWSGLQLEQYRYGIERRLNYKAGLATEAGAFFYVIFQIFPVNTTARTHPKTGDVTYP